MLGGGKVGLTAAQGVGTQNWEAELGESKTFLQVSFKGCEESGQLCFLDEGCSIRHCRHFSCFILV